jgi:hypothetical protein
MPVCHDCLRVVGMLPNGRALPYSPIVREDRLVVYVCIDRRRCKLAQCAAEDEIRRLETIPILEDQ